MVCENLYAMHQYLHKGISAPTGHKVQLRAKSMPEVYKKSLLDSGSSRQEEKLTLDVSSTAFAVTADLQSKLNEVRACCGITRLLRSTTDIALDDDCAMPSFGLCDAGGDY
jgi:hypothetical protein